MHASGNDWFTLIALAFAFGLKHGLDADHLAAIDGLARLHAERFESCPPASPPPSTTQVRGARWCGLLFSLGHGAIVVLVSGFAGALPALWRVPSWLEELGTSISIAALVGLGLANLHAVFATPTHQHVQTVGLRGSWFGRLRRNRHPAATALLGALFALSFDTMSLASLFALTGARLGSVVHAIALGTAFTLGMMLVDSLNGLWIARLLSRADRTALLASRVMGTAVAGLALAVAGFSATRYWLSAVADWSEGRELLLGVSVVAVTGVSFMTAMRMTRPAPAVARAARR